MHLYCLVRLLVCHVQEIITSQKIHLIKIGMLQTKNTVYVIHSSSDGE